VSIVGGVSIGRRRVHTVTFSFAGSGSRQHWLDQR
jgi:hypothetical protein